MYDNKARFINILCEGISEVAYLQELNRLFQDNELYFKFIPHNIGSGISSRVKKSVADFKKNNPKQDLYILIDYDLYVRDQNERIILQGSKHCLIWFSYMNFEDFLVLHLDKDILEKWVSICRERNHFNEPLHSSEYLSLVHQYLFSKYKKGNMPFTLNIERLRRLLTNNSNDTIPFHSDFADWLDTEFGYIIQNLS